MIRKDTAAIVDSSSLTERLTGFCRAETHLVPKVSAMFRRKSCALSAGRSTGVIDREPNIVFEPEGTVIVYDSRDDAELGGMSYRLSAGARYSPRHSLMLTVQEVEVSGIGPLALGETEHPADVRAERVAR